MSSLHSVPLHGIRLTALAALSAVVIVAAMPLPAQGANYTATPRLRQDLRFDNDFRLIGQDTDDVFIYELLPSVKFMRETEQLELTLDAEASFERLTDENFDSDNQRLRFDGIWEGQRSSLNFSAGLTRDSTRTSEEEITGDGTRIATATRRELARATSTYRHIIGARHSFTVTGSYQDSEYVSDEFNDFDYSLLQFSFSQFLSERTSLDYTVYATEFDSEVPVRNPISGDFVSTGNSVATTYAAQLGLNRAFTERFRGSLRAGVRSVDFDRDTLDIDLENSSPFCQIFLLGCVFSPANAKSSDDGYIAGADITYSGERSQFNMGVEISDRPSSQGLLRSKALTMSWERQLTERLYFIVDGRVSEDKGASTENPFQRDYARISPRLRWKFAQNWSLSSGIRFRNQTIGRQGDKTDSLALSLSLDYLPGPIPLGR